MELNKKKFTAFSKKLGYIVLFFFVIIIVFSCYMIYRTEDLSPLAPLVGGAMSVLAAYIGFYLTMAKAEHIEDKRTELHMILQKMGATEEYKQELENELERNEEKLNELEDSSIDINL